MEMLTVLVTIRRTYSSDYSGVFDGVLVHVSSSCFVLDLLFNTTEKVERRSSFLPHLLFTVSLFSFLYFFFSLVLRSHFVLLPLQLGPLMIAFFDFREADLFSLLLLIGYKVPGNQHLDITLPPFAFPSGSSFPPLFLLFLGFEGSREEVIFLSFPFLEGPLFKRYFLSFYSGAT